MTIPASVVLIKDWAFELCSNLERVMFEGTPIVDPSAFSHCPKLALALYREAPPVLKLPPGCRLVGPSDVPRFLRLRYWSDSEANRSYNTSLTAKLMVVMLCTHRRKATLIPLPTEMWCRIFGLI